MEIVKLGFALFLHGIKDCCVGVISLKDFLCVQEVSLENSRENVDKRIKRRSYSPGNVRIKLLECAIFGLFFWISNVLFHRFYLQYVFKQMLEWTGDENSGGLFVLLLALNTLFFIFWILPLFCLSKLLNFMWYQDIAGAVMEKSGLKKNENYRYSNMYADFAKSFILQMFYCFQGFSVYLLPLPVILQDLWYLFHFALLSSLYAFEYKWIHVGWPLQKRLRNIDRKWPYYLGFGLPLAVATTYVSSFIDSMIIFATLFPIYVISSSVTYDSQSHVFTRPFGTFKIADFISDIFIRLLMRMMSIPIVRS